MARPHKSLSIFKMCSRDCIRDLTLHGVDLREQACNPMQILSLIVTSKAAISFQTDKIKLA